MESQLLDRQASIHGICVLQDKTIPDSLSVPTTVYADSTPASPTVSSNSITDGLKGPPVDGRQPTPKGILRRGSSSSDATRSPWQPPLSDNRPETRIVAEVKPLEIKQEMKPEIAPVKKVSESLHLFRVCLFIYT